MSSDRIFGLVRRVLRRSITTATPSAQAQVESLADEVHNDVEFAESYGETACPPDDVPEGISLFVGGQSDHGLVLAWLDKLHRPTGLEPGETVRYSVFGQTLKFDKLGQVVITSGAGSTIQMAANGDIVCTPASGVMKVNGKLVVSEDLDVGGDINGAGNVQAELDVTAGGLSLQAHAHSGVQTGPSNTGGPV
jgi:phage baseplate assembly protein V